VIVVISAVVSMFGVHRVFEFREARVSRKIRILIGRPVNSVQIRFMVLSRLRFFL